MGRVMGYPLSSGIVEELFDWCHLGKAYLSQRFAGVQVLSIRTGEEREKELGQCSQSEAVPLGWHCSLLAWLASQQRPSWSWAVAASSLRA